MYNETIIYYNYVYLIHDFFILYLYNNSGTGNPFPVFRMSAVHLLGYLSHIAIAVEFGTHNIRQGFFQNINNNN